MEEAKEILEKLYDDFLKEKESVQKEVDNCRNKISEVNSYINSIMGMEDSDYKVFSPRNVENVYKDSLAEHKALKNKYENDYQNYLIKMERVETCLRRIEFLMLNSPDDLHYFEIQERERQRIARDLHDCSLQNLTHIVHKIELASMYIDKDVIQAKLELASISKNIKEVIEEIRNTIFDLRPMQFDDFGLRESIEQLVEKIKRESSLDIACNVDENINCSDQSILMSIYRIVQECINNAVKHSNGKLVKINIKKKDDYFDISISDNGEGFDVEEIFNEKAKKHFGLMILKERVNILHGTINIESELEKGTKVHIQLPLQYLK